MFTIKCFTHDGIQHTYEASQYTVPAEVQEDGRSVQAVVANDITHYVSPAKSHLSSVIIENSNGKTTQILRSREKASSEMV